MALILRSHEWKFKAKKVFTNIDNDGRLENCSSRKLVWSSTVRSPATRELHRQIVKTMEANEHMSCQRCVLKARLDLRNLLHEMQ